MRKRPRRRRPLLEALEPRIVLSETPGTLVTGDPLATRTMIEPGLDQIIRRVAVAPDLSAWVVIQTSPQGVDDVDDIRLTRLSHDGQTVLAQADFGGPGMDFVMDVAVAPDGGIAIVGFTTSKGLATAGAEQTERRGSQDGFVARFAPDGDLVFASYVGAGRLVDDSDLPPDENITAVAFDPAGNVLVGGSFLGRSFFDGPRGEARIEVFGHNHTFTTVDRLFQETNIGNASEAFVSGYNASGGVTFTALFGGEKVEGVGDLAIGPDGEIVAVGLIVGPEEGQDDLFPLVNALEMQPAEGAEHNFRAGFLTRLAPNATTLRQSTYFGKIPDGLTQPPRVAVDGAGHIYVLGVERSGTEAAPAGVAALPLTKLSPTGRTVLYSRSFGARDASGQLVQGRAPIGHELGVTSTGEAVMLLRLDGIDRFDPKLPVDQIQRIQHDGERVLAVTHANTIQTFGFAGHRLVHAGNAFALGNEPFRVDLGFHEQLIVNANSDLPDADDDPLVIDVDPDQPGAQISLRAAMTFANESPGTNTLLIDLEPMIVDTPDPGDFTVNLGAKLPDVITRMVVIGSPAGAREDLSAHRLLLLGSSSSAFLFAGPGIENDEEPLPDASGFGSRFHDLALGGFSSHGVVIETDNVELRRFLIGTDTEGRILRNGGHGVKIDGSNNVVSTGAILGSGGHGVLVDGSNNEVNFLTIADNRRHGVAIVGGVGNIVDGNDIGLNSERTAALGNGEDGIRVETQEGQFIFGNLVAGNRGLGINVEGGDGHVIGVNEVGWFSPSGTVVANGSDGIRLFRTSGSTINANVVIGHVDGILVSNPTGPNTIEFNRVGVALADEFGVAERPAGNRGTGIHLLAASNHQVHANVVGNSGIDGILITGGGGNVLTNNRIGVGVVNRADGPGFELADFGNAQDGVAVLNSNNNQIGAFIPIEGVDENGDGIDDETFLPLFIIDTVSNVIAGNGAAGIHISGSSTGNRVEGNSIGFVRGLESGVTGPLPNAVGVHIEAAANHVGHNVISGNAGPGIELRQPGTTANTIEGNYVGLLGFLDLFEYFNDPNLADDPEFGRVGNQGPGILIWQAADRNLIGDVEDVWRQANRIAFNNGPGIAMIDLTVENQLRGNFVMANQGLAVDLDDDGFTLNDAGDLDGGPNLLQNHPIVHGFVRDLDTIQVNASLIGVPGATYQVDFYAQDGTMFLGSSEVVLDSNGSLSFTFLATVPDSPVSSVMAMATDAQGNSSEMSPLTLVVNTYGNISSPDPLNPDTDPDQEGAQVTLFSALAFASARAGAERVIFNLGTNPGSLGDGVLQVDFLPVIEGPVFIDGSTQPGQGRVVLEGAGSIAGPRSGLTFGTTSGSSHVSHLTIRNFEDHGIESSHATGVLHLHSIELLSNGLAGLHSLRSVEIGDTLGADGFVTADGFTSRIEGNQLGVRVAAGKFTARNLTVSNNLLGGILARDTITLTAARQAVQVNNNGGPGVYSDSGVIIDGASLFEHQIKDNKGPGIVANGVVSVDSGDGNGGESVVLVGRIEISGNALDGIRAEHDVTLQGPLVVVRDNGHGAEARDLFGPVTSNSLPEPVTTIRGHGILSRRGSVFNPEGLGDLIVSRNNGGGIVSGDAIILLTGASQFLVTANEGPGLFARNGGISLHGDPVVRLNRGDGIVANTTGGVRIEGTATIEDNAGWGIVSRDDAVIGIFDAVDISLLGLHSIRRNGRADRVIEIALDDDGGLAFVDRVGADAFSGGVLSVLGGIQTSATIVEDNGGHGLLSGRGIEVIGTRSLSIAHGLLANGNRGDGLHAAGGDITIRSNAVVEASRNQGIGLAASDRVIVESASRLELRENADSGLVAGGDARLEAFVQDIAFNGRGDVAFGLKSDDLVAPRFSEVLAGRTDSGAVSRTGELIVGAGSIKDNLRGELQAARLLDLRQVDLTRLDGSTGIVRLRDVSGAVDLGFSIEGPSTILLERVATPGGLPEDFFAPLGAVALRISGLSPGARRSVDIHLARSATGGDFHKFGPRPNDPTPGWYPWAFDGDVGAIVLGRTIRLSLRDGALGDDDLTANGEIIDPHALLVRNDRNIQLDESEATIQEGRTLVTTGFLIDPTFASEGITVDYGDGSPAEPVELDADGRFTLAHRYPRSGQFEVRLIDGEGRIAERPLRVIVANVAPTVVLGADEVLPPGAPFHRQGRFEDPGDDAWTALVDYGDGTGERPLARSGDRSFILDHRYARPGTFIVRVTVLDGDGGSGTASITVTALPSAASPPTLERFEVNGRKAQRSNIETNTLYFDQDVNIQQLIDTCGIVDAIKVYGLTNNTHSVILSPSNYLWNADSRTLMIDLTIDGFGGSARTLLADDNYELRLRVEDIRNSDGVSLNDSDGINDGFVRLSFHRLEGDFDGDKNVDSDDRNYWFNPAEVLFGSRVGEAGYSIVYDHDGDGIISSRDYHYWLRRLFGRSLR